MLQPWILTGEQSGLLTHIAGDGKRFVVRADEKLTAFMELESATRPRRKIAIEKLAVRAYNRAQMPAAANKEIELEIAYVLFIDIVGYSNLVTHEQRRLLELLNRMVREAEHFRTAEANGRLITVPTGDGMALVFYNTPEAPVECALEIGRAGREHPELKLRMGMHSGPVSGVVDVSGRSNITGAGINIAHRVMDCGDAGHVLISKHMAEDLEQYGHWKRHLHDLGECEVKHGVRIAVVNLYTEDLGNPEVPQKFRQARKGTAPVVGEKKGRGWIIAAAVVLTVALIIGGVLFSRRSSLVRAGTGAPPAPPMQVIAAIPEKSIAVMPFDNLSRDPDNAYFCEGVQDEILMRLAKVADLKVISRTSTQHFKSAPENLPQIAKQLGVTNILEGSVQKANDQVRVNVQLINAMTDAHLWADTFDRKLTDIFAVETEIAKTIAETLQARLTGSEKSSIAKTPTVNPEAYELYLKGRFFWNKRTGEDLRKSIEYFNQAIAKDPNYALAYAGLADSYVLLSVYASVSQKESLSPARASAKKALELDDSLAEAHASLGLLATLELDLDRANRELERAVQLKPNYATAHHWFAWSLMTLGRFDPAIAEGKRAVELDPLSLIINADFSRMFFFARRYDEAEAQARKTLEMDSRFYRGHYYLGEALQFKGHLAEAIPEFQKAFDLNHDPYSLAMLGQAYARNGQKGEARNLLTQLNEEAKSHFVAPYAIALILTGLGEKERAIDELERAYREGESNNLFIIKVDPMLDDLRGQPRFEALEQKIVGGK